jgi:hypothetical protein
MKLYDKRRPGRPSNYTLKATPDMRFGGVETHSEDRATQSLPLSREQETLVSYEDLSKTRTHYQEVEQLDSFGRLLLVACRCANDPRLLA